jgi:hypothetical protein
MARPDRMICGVGRKIKVPWKRTGLGNPAGKLLYWERRNAEHGRPRSLLLQRRRMAVAIESQVFKPGKRILCLVFGFFWGRMGFVQSL